MRIMVIDSICRRSAAMPQDRTEDLVDSSRIMIMPSSITATSKCDDFLYGERNLSAKKIRTDR